MRRLISLLVAGFLAISASGAYSDPQGEKSLPSKQAPLAEEKAGTVGHFPSGKVVETMNAGGYTYVCLKKGGKKTWVAVPEMKVTVGQQMVFKPGQEMKDFTSKTLNRTFASIIFSEGPAASQENTSNKVEPAKAPGSKAAVVASAGKISVEKAAGPDAYTVGEVYAKRASLNGKAVVVKGKVVKVSKGIMGKNWIHLRDGTGTAGKDNDVTVTSQDATKLGEVVTVQGKVAVDQDIGMGTPYPVIVQDAKVAR